MLKRTNASEQILGARVHLRQLPSVPTLSTVSPEAEGGCGVTGFASSIPVRGAHIYRPSMQMHNRGNGKGGGIAAVGLSAEQMNVDEEILNSHFLLHVALLDESVIPDLERRFIGPCFSVAHESMLETAGDYRDIPGLEVNPPKVKRYFVRVLPEVLTAFEEERGLTGLPSERIEEEFIYQNTFQINLSYYSSLGEKKAFVLSHGRNMMILKIVGYAELVVQYYQLENVCAHVWIAHQRYPTKGRVWHPGGAHPFAGMNEALVHNGDFANYYSVTEYLRQHNVHPLFLTDTEVSVQVFDLLNRVYGYPLEYIIEALAPTVETDFDHLPEEKQHIYRMIQATHIHGSPDGPWFFIIARSLPDGPKFQLIGITDTAMLRPQVFALQKGEVEIGLICSEKQAIDATLESLAQEDSRFGTVADRYWNARGGSYTDGGAFVFTVQRSGNNGDREVVCTDKFGRTIDVARGSTPRMVHDISSLPGGSCAGGVEERIRDRDAAGAFSMLTREIPFMGYGDLQELFNTLIAATDEYVVREQVISLLSLLLDRRYPTGNKRRRSLIEMYMMSLNRVFNRVPLMNGARSGDTYARIDFQQRRNLREPLSKEHVLVMNVEHFPPEGDDCDARFVCDAYMLGWRRFMCFGYKGQRFLGCGFGPETRGVCIDAYGSTGDYVGSGLDGSEIRVHGNAQDQVGQILKRGKLVIYGDVGQAFMYGAKGGEAYVLGNAAGRPLINAVGKPRVVINGTTLDFLAESFMAGDPHHGGGFIVLNGLSFDDDGQVIVQETPYPGSNLFSLASGGAIYVRDPYRKIVPEQLNSGEIVAFTERDWNLIRPYLEENERLFGISVRDHLLTVDGECCSPTDVYRTVRAVKMTVLTGLDEWE